MTRKTTMVLALWAMLTSNFMFAQKDTEQALEKEANALFTSGEFLKAYPLFSQLVSLNPSNGDYSYKFGACAIFSDPDKTKAIKFLSGATKKSVSDPMVWYYLGKAYHLNYQFKEAVQSYEKFLATADAKISGKTDAQRNIETCIYGSNLLSNIKDLTVISKTESDKQNFFRYINLDGIGGKIVTVPEELKSNLDKKSKTPGVIHYPGNSTTIYFSSLGKDGANARDIFSAQMTPDGKYVNVQQIKGDVNTKYDEDFCFMHSDGKTLYFSSKGHNSMGGFDIFKSELDPNTGTFGRAINLDFAINTPDDDIFYIADSLNQRAYFASARSSDLDHMHVYNVMVTSQPMQVVYLKGMYANTIDSEELKATFQLVDNNSNKITSDGTTNASNGDYLGYVEHSGEYTMKVKTANSPTIHEITLQIPKFEKPVALRQEMKLISEGGQEKLIVTNFFETPLDTDLSDLSSEMLRRKAKLDVNSSAPSVSTPDEVSANVGEKDITKVALSAGFSDAETPDVVAKQMLERVAKWKAESAQADQRSKYAQMYASSKHSEAEEKLKEAEAIRKSTSGYNTEDDLIKIKASIALTEEATELQREAEAALLTADLEDKQTAVCNERAERIEEQERTLSQSLISGDYSTALLTLTNEKQSRKDESPVATQIIQSDLTKAVGEKEKEVAAAESKLSEMREKEAQLKIELKSAELAMQSAKKDKDKQSTEFAYISKKSELDALRKNIKTHQATIKTLGSDLEEAKADQAFYSGLIGNPTLGFKNAPEALMDTERLALGMKLKGMDNRLASLEITDQSTLAMLGEMESKPESSSAQQEAAEPTVLPTAVVSVNSAPSPTALASAANDNSNLSSTVEMVQNTPALAPAKHMVITQRIAETDRKISYFEQLKRQGNLTIAQNNELIQLNSTRNELQMQLASSPAPEVKISDEDAREIFASVDPNYSAEIIEITNGKGTSVDQAMAMIAYREALNLKIADARMAQTRSIQSTSDTKSILDMAANDSRMEAAQQKLMSEPSEVALMQGAYEQENKTIIESNALFNEKLEDQIAITENYSANLGTLIKAKQTSVEIEPDQSKAIQMRTEIGLLKQEQEKANSKLETYLKDLQLTASATTGSNQKTDQPKNSVAANDITASPPPSDVIEVEQDTKVVESILKPRVEQESVFAYESSLFEELLAKYETPNNKLNNRDKIQKINDEIFLIEAEMENETNESKLRKLDYKAEQMYLQRADAESQNAPIIAAITLQAFGDENTKANDGIEAKEAEIEQSALVRDEIRALMTSAQNNMAESEELRKAAPMKEDAIEKADMYRLAFAKEALAIQQLKQVQDITNNIDVLTNYSEADIASMRSGRVPSQEPTTLAIGISGNPDQLSSENSSAQTSTEEIQAQVVKKNDSTTETKSTITNPSEGLAIQTDNASTGTEAKSTTGASNPSSVGIVKSDAIKGSDLINNSTVALKGDSKVEPANTESSIAMKSEDTSGAALALSNPKVAPVEVGNNFPIAPRTASSDNSASSSAEAEYSAENYLFNAPTMLKGDLFMRTSRPVYSENKPIPVDIAMPQGVYYKVQVGAFRKDIPQSLYDEFAPVCGEKLNNGITRYTAGFFVTLSNANAVKQSIRSLGYSDAFVVAYLNGKRIPIYEALAMTNGENIAANGNTGTQNFNGVANSKVETIAPETKPNIQTAKLTNTSESIAAEVLPGKLKPDYYQADAGSVQADQVEKIEGLFFTVQVGVYSKPVNSSLLGYITPLNTELLQDTKLRYTSGRYTNMKDAAYKRDQAKSLGINDAFITAYFNGLRITIAEAERLLSEKGMSILAK